MKLKWLVVILIVVNVTINAFIMEFSNSLFKRLSDYACMIVECCEHKWTPDGVLNKLQNEIDEKLFGQHIAKDIVLRAIKAHVLKSNPNKPLVMSFHGWTGTGKNYLAKLIASSIYKKGMNSKFVHLISATHDFPHAENVRQYREDLKSWVKGNLTMCERSLFIFDEIDKMPFKLIDAIVPFIDFYDIIGGVDPRKSIFLLLSNDGGKRIAEETLSFYNKGKHRTEITYKQMENTIKESAYNEGDGGLKMSRLIERHMIDYYIPFLPLERRHVLMCFKEYFKKKFSSANIQPDVEEIENLADSLHYFPKANQIYSVTGCKQVEQKTDFYYVDRFNALDEL